MMSEGADRKAQGAFAAAGEDPRAMERRFFRGMCVTVTLAVLVSAPLAPWRVTTGLLLGGLLSLLSHHWLRTSVEAAFGDAPPGARPKLRVLRYFLRYFVIAGAVWAADWLGLVSVGATVAGLCSVVPAALAEGFRQLYFAISRREET
jgi:hypothetical protein